jgi:uncharacterized damage-inducible protein DinB
LDATTERNDVNRLLRDLYSHQAWADALIWKGMEAFPPALKDTAIRNRQHHYHFTQTAFLWVARGKGEPFKRTKPEDYRTDAELKALGREVNEAFRAFLDGVTESRMQEIVEIPWGPPQPRPSLTLELALTQGAMHSHHHRAQNIARLRELGGTPLPEDFIFWLWKGKPEPDWG